MKFLKLVRTKNQVKLLDSYIWGQLLESFLLGIAVFTAIVFASNTFITLVKQVVVFGVPLPIAFMIIILKLPMIITMTIPMSVLLSAVMTVSNLSSNQEITIMKSCGISLKRIAKPVMFFAVICSLLCFILTEFVSPYANQQAKKLTMYSLSTKNLPDNIKNFSMKETDRYGKMKRLFYINNVENGNLNQIAVLNKLKDNAFQVLMAKSGSTSDMTWNLKDVTIYTISEDGNVLNTTISKDFSLLSRIVSAAKLEKHKEQELSFLKLKSYIKEFKTAKKKLGTSDDKGVKKHIAKLNIHLFDKFAVPLTSIVFALIAIPLSITPPRAKLNRGALFSIVILFFYYLIRALSVSMGENGLLPPLLASFLPIIIIGTVGAVMLKRKIELV